MMINEWQAQYSQLYNLRDLDVRHRAQHDLQDMKKFQQTINAKNEWLNTSKTLNYY